MPELIPTTFVAWTCGCSDAQTDASRLPAKCPGHDRHPIDPPEALAVLPQFVDLHICGDTRTCDVLVNAPTGDDGGDEA